MTHHDRYVRALRGFGFAPVSKERHFGKEGEVFCRDLQNGVFVWAYDDYGLLWSRGFPPFFDSDILALELSPDLFSLHVSRNLR